MLDSVTTTAPNELLNGNVTKTNKATNSNYAYSPDWMFENPGENVGDDFQVNSAQTTQTQQTTNTTQTKGNLVSGCADGKDDGKVGVGEAICNFFWGAIKSVGKTVVDIVTDPKKALLAVATTALCIAFPPAGVVLGAVGVVSGVAGVVSGVKRAVTIANDPNGTDADAKAAIQDIGASSLQTVLSAVAVKGSLNAMKSTSGSAMSKFAETKVKGQGLKGAVENAKNGAKAFAEDTVTGGRGFTRSATGKVTGINQANAGYKGTQIYTSVKKNVGDEGLVKGLGKTASEGYGQYKANKLARSAQKDYNKYGKMDDAAKAEFEKGMADDLAKAADDVTAAKTKVAELESKVASAADDVKPQLEADLNAARAQLEAANKTQTNVQNYQKQFEAAKASTTKAEQTLTDAKDALEKQKGKLETAQESYEAAVKGGNKAKIEAAKTNLDNVQGTYDTLNSQYKAARADVRVLSSNPITHHAQKFSNAAKAAGYNSGFGALTPSVTIQQTVENAQTAQQNQLNYLTGANRQSRYSFGDYTYNNASVSRYTPGAYSFNNDYETAAANARYVASQVINSEY